MPTAAAALLDELEREAKPTRKILARVPGDKLAWQPHPRSMTSGSTSMNSPASWDKPATCCTK